MEEASGSPDEKRTAERVLLTLRQTGSTSNYAAKFRQEAAKLALGDKVLMIQFYQGLKDDVKDSLVMEDRPDALEAYIERAIRIDNSLYKRRQEKKKEKRIDPRS